MLTPDKTYTIQFGNEALIVNEKILPDDMFAPKKILNAKGGIAYNKGDPIKSTRKVPINQIYGVVAHNTNDLTNVEDDGEQYTRATLNWAMGGVIVHFYVDDLCAWQNLNINGWTNPGYHAGCGQKIVAGNKGIKLNGNVNCFGVEIIMNGGGSEADKKAERNGAMLIAWLLTKLDNRNEDDVYSHLFFASDKKYCPAFILPHWSEFKKQIKYYLNILRGIENDVTLEPIPVHESTQSIIVGLGEKIRVSKDATTWHTGKTIAAWCKTCDFYVRKVESDRVLIAPAPEGATTGWLRKKDIKQSAAAPKTYTIAAIRKSGSQNGTILTELGYIKASVDDIKRKQEQTDARYIELSERLTAVDASTRSAHRRIDEMAGQHRPS